MQDFVSKRAFIRGRLTTHTYIRPPGTVSNFTETCTKCDACVTACPTDIIAKDEQGYPIVDLNSGTCLFCEDCANVCESGAIANAKSWDIRAKVTADCLSYNGVTCRTCEDHCDELAISFRLLTGARSVPIIDLDTCTGCGACADPCPANAITFHEPPVNGDRPC